MNILFWNVGRNRCEQPCATLARKYEPDIVALAECIDPLAMLKRLNHGRKERLYLPHPVERCKRITLYSPYAKPDYEEVASGTHHAIHRLETGSTEELLIVTLHSSSSLRTKPEDQFEEHRRLATEIATLEDQRGHTRTIVVGDFNAQPFDRRMMSAVGFHATMSRTIARKGSRRVKGKDYRFFFNPMWRFFAQGENRPHGTYYRDKSEHAEDFWYLFDQILIRPALLDRFGDEDISVLTDDGENSLQLADGRPNKAFASDHLPVLLRLKDLEPNP